MSCMLSYGGMANGVLGTPQNGALHCRELMSNKWRQSSTSATGPCGRSPQRGAPWGPTGPHGAPWGVEGGVVVLYMALLPTCHDGA